jgi:hypothetical protein
MHHEVDLDFFIRVEAQRHLLLIISFRLHLILCVLRWESRAFATSKLDFSVKHRYFIDDLA